MNVLWTLGLLAGILLPAPPALPPEDLVVSLRRARIAEEEGRQEDARAHLRAAAEAHPDSLLPVLALWEHHLEFGLPSAEGKELRRILVTRLADPASPLPPGALGYLTEDPHTAVADLESVLVAARKRLAATSDDTRLLETVALLELRLGRREEAWESLTRLLERKPGSALRWRRLMLDRELERWEDAASLLAVMVEEPDPFPFARLLYLEVLGKLGRYDDVLRQLALVEASSELDAATRYTFASQLLQAAWNLRDLDKSDEAEKLFRRVLSLDEENASARDALLYLYGSDEERAAHESRLEARWQAEDDPMALAEEGANLLASGNDGRAFDLLERAAAGLPDSAANWFNLGVAAMKLERWGTAERAFQKTVAIRPDRAEALVNLGAALENLDRCDEAIAKLERALTLDPALSRAHYYLYTCHKTLGNPGRARHHLDAYNRGRFPNDR